MFAPLAVKVADCPAQMVSLFTKIVGTGFTVTTAETGSETQPAVVPVKVNVVVSPGLTLMLLPVAPLLHA